MPIDPILWKAEVINVLDRISDEAYQKRAWFNNTEVSSANELICELFDDYLFDEYIESDEIKLTVMQKIAARSFALLVNKLVEKYIDLNDSATMINNEDWKKIRFQALNLTKQFRS